MQTLPTKPLVSIGIALYNHEYYIKECIDSILNQTYDNIEIIVIDDGSKDASYQSALHAFETNPIKRPYILKTRPNKGMCNTLNEIITLAKGEYISFVGSDDFCQVNTKYTKCKSANVLKSQVQKKQFISSLVKEVVGVECKS